METLELIGYIASALVGILLGLIGGGGSILTVPVMVYLFGIQPLLATSYSLFIVGLTSLIGAIGNFRKGQVDLKAGTLFGASSVFTVFLIRKYIIPAIPENIGTVNGFIITEHFFTMLLFGALMLTSAVAMIKDKGDLPDDSRPVHGKLLKLLAYGVSIGLVTGLLGAGGGFLLIPALVFLVKLPLKKAIGTSLLIIALNSLIGFAGDLGHFDIEWKFLAVVTAIAIAGVITGGVASKKISAEKLKKMFGWFVLIMAIYIILKEVLSVMEA